MHNRLAPRILGPLALVSLAAGTLVTGALVSGVSASTPGTTAAGAAGSCTLDTPLKIGYAADLSELAAFADQPGSEAAKVMIDQINAAGGVGGKPVEYMVKDIQGDPAATQRAAQELLDAGVNAMIGPPFTATGSPLLDTVNGKAPIIFMSSTDKALADPSRGAFLASFSDAGQSTAIAEYALKLGKKTAVTLSSTDDAYFTANPEYFKAAFEAGGGKVLQDFSFSLADTDFSTQINEIASMSEKPEVLFTAMPMPWAQTMLEQVKAAGLSDLQVMSVDGYDATAVWNAGAASEGVFFVAHAYPQPTNGIQKFIDEATAAGAKIETVAFGALAADAVQVLAHAAETACSTDPAKLIEAIDAIDNLTVVTGSITYKGANGVPVKDVNIMTVTDGKPAFVEAIRPTLPAG